MSHLENCVGRVRQKRVLGLKPKRSGGGCFSSGLTILACVTCVCLVFLQPFSTSTADVKTQPSFVFRPFASSPSAPMPSSPTPAPNYQPLQATATQAGEPSYYFQQPPPASQQYQRLV